MSIWAKTKERVKKLEKQHGRISRYMGSGMYGKCGSELERPYPSPKGKEKAYSLAKAYSDGRESEGNIVPIITVQENAVYGKVPYFIHVCREGKSERMSC